MRARTPTSPPAPPDSADAPTSRDQHWFTQLFTEYHLHIRKYAVRQVGPDDADDLVNAVFSVAWRHSERVPQNPLPWLYTVARYEVLHHRRSQARGHRVTSRLSGLAETGDHEHDHADAVAGQAHMQQVLDQMPAKEAEVLTLTAWEGLSPAQIATVMQCTTAAVRVRLHRARRRAQALLAAPTQTPTSSTQPLTVKEYLS